MDFETYWTTINPNNELPDRYEAAREAWAQYPEKQEPIMKWLARHGAYQGRNPYFFILDFKVRGAVGEPTNYNGKALPKEPVFSAKYKGKWGMYTQADIAKYGMETRH